MRKSHKILFRAAVLLLLLPRLALLQNGLDAQRIWDTNTPDAFRFLSSVALAKDDGFGAVINFLNKDHKYPLLGSYFHVPVIGSYYIINRFFGIYDSSDNFVNTYALGETNLFFWIRLSMLSLNLLAVWGLWRLVKNDSGERAGLYLIILTSVSFYLTVFSVTPRIHSLAFASSVLVMWSALRLLKEKSLKNYLLAWGSVAVAFSISQSSITTIVFPLLAHFFSDHKLQIANYKKYLFDKKFWAGIALFLFITLSVGYPQLVLSRFAGGEASILSAEHGGVRLGLVYFFDFFKNYFILTIPAIVFALFAGFFYKFKNKLKFENFTVLCLAQIFFFLILFGFTNVVNGRFALVILPALLYVAANALTALEKFRFTRYTAFSLIVLQAVSVIWLVPVSLKKDTRELASRTLEKITGADLAVVSMIDHHWLSLPPAPSAVREGAVKNIGTTDLLIEERALSNKASRYIASWDGVSNLMHVKRPVGAVLVTAGEDFHDHKNKLEAQGFALVESFDNGNNETHADYFAWGREPHEGFWPLSFSVLKYKRMGPSLFVFKKSL